jgi:hypothetical protein
MARERDDHTIAARLPLWAGVLAGPLFLAIALLEGVRGGYDPVRMPISLLALGSDGWTQTANFLIAGGLYLAFAIALLSSTRVGSSSSRPMAIVLAVVALGLLGAGIFPTDPGLGYPPRDVGPSGGTIHGSLHDLCSLAVFGGLPIVAWLDARWCAMRGDRRSAAVSTLAAVVLAIGFVALLAGFNGVAEIGRVAGLVQRAWLVVGFGWLSLVATRFAGQSPR